MKPMQIDFAAPGWRRALYRVHPGWLAAGALGALMLLGGAALGVQASKQQSAREEALHAQQRKLAVAARAPQRKPETAIPEAQAAAVNAAILQLNLPWRQLQDAVAAANSPSVALLALDPDPRKQTLRITAEAKNSDDMVGYVEQLKQQEFFAGAALLRHETNEQDPNRPLRFQVEVQWRAR
jgi:Tfp pilus assembly protein PilN